MDECSDDFDGVFHDLVHYGRLFQLYIQTDLSEKREIKEEN